MSLTVDFTNVEGGDFEPIEPGKYDAVVWEVKKEEAKSGNMMLVWEFKLQDEEYQNRRAWYRSVLLPNCMWKLKQILKRIAPEYDLSGKLEIDPDDLAGRKCRLVMTYDEEYENDKVEDILAPKEDELGDGDLPPV